MSRILPLKGKYYGTEIELRCKGEMVVVWLRGQTHDEIQPSARQLEDWDNPNEDELRDLMCDSHYETVRDFSVAIRICDLLA